jgi:hypothetical protein
MTDPVNIPDGILSSDFPAPADRTAGVFNSKALAWANSARDMSERDREIAVAGRTNAVSSRESAVAADLSRQQSQQARDDAQTAADDAGDSAAVVGRWDKLVLGPKDHFPTADNDGAPLLVGAEFYHTVLLARYSWSGLEWRIGTNVTAGVESVNGNPGPAVILGIADVVAPGDIVAYGPTKPAARAAIDAGYDYPRGTLTLTTSQTLNRDATFGAATYVLVEAWGGGASGNAYVNANGSAAGGEGGEYVARVFRIEDLPASIVATIGAGGAGVTATSSGSFIRAPANSGGSTSFGALLTARGGLANLSSDANLGAYAPSKITTLAGKNGGDGGGSVPNSSTADRRLAPGPGGDSVYGGGGGGGAGGTGNPYMAGGTSVFGGAGGAGGYSTSSGAVGSPGAARGGGGGGAMVMKTVAAGDTAKSGAGGRGEIKLTWW